LRQQLIEVVPASVRFTAGSVGHPHLHAERETGRPRHPLAERTVPDDAELASGEFTQREVEQAELVVARPRTRANQRVVLPQVLRQQQHRSQHVLHHGRRAVVAQVADRDTETSLERVIPEVLRLWEMPSRCVVLGRASKWAEEANAIACERDSVPILRRVSGGASIVAGPGCLMYSVLLSYQIRPSVLSVKNSTT